MSPSGVADSSYNPAIDPYNRTELAPATIPDPWFATGWTGATGGTGPNVTHFPAGYGANTGATGPTSQTNPEVLADEYRVSGNKVDTHEKKFMWDPVSARFIAVERNYNG
jgi:hypothetical protein